MNINVNFNLQDLESQAKEMSKYDKKNTVLATSKFVEGTTHFRLLPNTSENAEKTPFFYATAYSVGGGEADKSDFRRYWGNSTGFTGNIGITDFIESLKSEAKTSEAAKKLLDSFRIETFLFVNAFLYKPTKLTPKGRVGGTVDSYEDLGEFSLQFSSKQGADLIALMKNPAKMGAAAVISNDANGACFTMDKSIKNKNISYVTDVDFFELDLTPRTDLFADRTFDIYTDYEKLVSFTNKAIQEKGWI